MTLWPDQKQVSAAAKMLWQGVKTIRDCQDQAMQPTVRPQTTKPLHQQGNYAFRWFDTPVPNWQEFFDLCVAAWPGFESAYDSPMISLWELVGVDDTMRRTSLLTRRSNLAMWERSKTPEGEVEAAV